MKILPTNIAFDISHTSLTIDLLQNSVILRGPARTCRGTVLNGYLSFATEEGAKLRALILNFKGVESINSSSQDTSIVTQRTVFSHTWQFLPLRTENHTVTAGHHSHYFEVALPGNLPETVQTAGARVEYRLTAMAIRPAFRKDLVVERPVLLQRYAITDQTLEPEALINQGKLGNAIDYQLRVNERRVALGDQVALDMHLHCTSHSYISKVWMVLTEQVTVVDSKFSSLPETNGFFMLNHASAPYHPPPFADLLPTPTRSAVINEPAPGINTAVMSSAAATSAASSASDSASGTGCHSTRTVFPTPATRGPTIVSVKHIKEVVDSKFPEIDPVTRTIRRQYVFSVPERDAHYDVDTENIRIRHRIRMVFQIRNKLNIEGHVALSFSLRLLPGRPGRPTRTLSS
ncbi:hypothetical protein IWQ60_001897 [Tieghemiomyces parasiticus]|uniref:LDB19 N-terminal domain-containing protein n=1 Tax=Tieghemiomyces parasiticus TaxID=78921 RepID=A0A9W8AD51_9FUNG|nr:hypothetical protein IWQ60_001897 [Tieghemiomyces parasiticus]